MITVVFSEIRLYKNKKKHGNVHLPGFERNWLEQVQEVVLILFTTFNWYKPQHFANVLWAPSFVAAIDTVLFP